MQPEPVSCKPDKTVCHARLAIDIGGTFTDVVLELADRSRVTSKLLTTGAHPGDAVLAGIADVMQRSDVTASDVGLIIHGTTLATNALIERRGATTALLTTAGHRDVLEMAHEDRFEQYDINIERPAPLVPRYLRLPIRERMNHKGELAKDARKAALYAGWLRELVSPGQKESARPSDIDEGQERVELVPELLDELGDESGKWIRVVEANGNELARRRPGGAVVIGEAAWIGAQADAIWGALEAAYTVGRQGGCWTVTGE